MSPRSLAIWCAMIPFALPGSGTLIILPGSSLAAPLLYPKTKIQSPPFGVVPLGTDVANRVAIQLAPDLGENVRRGADLLAAHLAALGGAPGAAAPAVITTSSVPDSITLLIRVGPASWGDPDLSPIPDQAEGYAIQFRRQAGRTEALVAGADPAGAFWGMMTLRQLAEDAPAGPRLVKVMVADWPDQRWRSIPLAANADTNYLDIVTRLGRVNTISYGLIPGKNGVPLSPATLSNDFARLRDYGIRPVVFGGYWRERAQLLNGREFCPIRDTTNLLALYAHALDAGAQGVAWHFDDLFMYPADLRHHLTCPYCSTQFASLAASQAYSLQALRTLALAHGKTNLWACPTIYSLNGTNTYKKELGLSIGTYLGEFCHFAGSDDYKFYFCEFRTNELAFIKQQGLRNFIWWNNGPWTAGGYEVWNAYVDFARMFYSWDLYNPQAISLYQAEVFYTNRYTQLAALKDETDLVYSGASDPISVGLGTHFAWNNAVFVAGPCLQEAATRRYLMGELYGASRRELADSWAALAKPLWIKLLRLRAFDTADLARLAELDAVAESLLQVDNRCTRIINPDLGEVRNSLHTYAGLLVPYTNAPLSPTYYLGRGSGVPLDYGPAAARPAGLTDLPATVYGGAPTQVVANYRVALLHYSNAVEAAANSAFTFNRTNFSVEITLTPVQATWCNLVGSRVTYRECWSGYGLKGWAVGRDPDEQRARFTLETTNGTISSLTTRYGGVPLYQTTHIVAVRDWNQKKLRLYVNGVLDAEITESGDGMLGSGAVKAHIGVNYWTGQFMNGALHRVTLHDRALSAEEIRVRAPAGATPHHITLPTPLRPGDYAVHAQWNGGIGSVYRPTLLLVRPDPLSGGTLLYNSGPLATCTNMGFAFDRSRGDLFYFGGTNGHGGELRVLRHGQTQSLLLASDIRSAGGRLVRAIAADTNGVIISLEDNGQLRRLTPTVPHGDTYTAADWIKLPYLFWQGGNLTLTHDGRFLLLSDALRWSASFTSRLFTLNTDSGAIVSTLTAPGSNSTALAGSPFCGPVALLPDYAHGTNAAGFLRLLAVNGGYLSTNDRPRVRITELAFHPVNGLLTNLYAAGGGNFAPNGVNSNTRVVLSRSDNNTLGHARFDNDGNLIVVPVQFSSSLRGQLFDQAQLDGAAALLDVLTGQHARPWSGLAGPDGNFAGVNDFAIAPLPDPP